MTPGGTMTTKPELIGSLMLAWIIHLRIAERILNRGAFSSMPLGILVFPGSKTAYPDNVLDPKT